MAVLVRSHKTHFFCGFWNKQDFEINPRIGKAKGGENNNKEYVGIIRRTKLSTLAYLLQLAEMLVILIWCTKNIKSCSKHPVVNDYVILVI